MSEVKKIALVKEITEGEDPLKGESRGIAKLDGNKLILSLNGFYDHAISLYYVVDNMPKKETVDPLGEEYFVSEGIKSFVLGKEIDGKFFPLAYARFSVDGESYEEIVEIAQKLHQNKVEKEVENAVFQEKEEYDDEQIADYNYYEECGGGLEDEEQPIGDKLFVGANENERKEEEIRNEESDKRDEIRDGSSEFFSGETKTFYQKIEGEIVEIFKKFPKESNLEKTVANSRWVKIEGENGKHYVVGIIKKDGIPTHICYGLPSDFYSPPPEMKGYKSFIPLSVFDLKGKGYWVTFQNAQNGLQF